MNERRKLTAEEVRIAELENEVEQLKARLRGATWRIDIVTKQNAFLLLSRELDPYAEQLVLSGK